MYSLATVGSDETIPQKLWLVVVRMEEKEWRLIGPRSGYCHGPGTRPTPLTENEKEVLPLGCSAFYTLAVSLDHVTVSEKLLIPS